VYRKPPAATVGTPSVPPWCSNTSSNRRIRALSAVEAAELISPFASIPFDTVTFTSSRIGRPMNTSYVSDPLFGTVPFAAGLLCVHAVGLLQLRLLNATVATSSAARAGTGTNETPAAKQRAALDLLELTDMEPSFRLG
jgi:hypothetical protein